MLTKSVFTKNYQALVLVFFLLGTASYSYAQEKIGKNRTSIGVSSLLELEHPTKCLLLMTIADTASITAPKEGMMIYHNPVIGTPVIRIYQAGHWVQFIVFNRNIFLYRKPGEATA